MWWGNKKGMPERLHCRSGGGGRIVLRHASGARRQRIRHRHIRYAPRQHSMPQMHNMRMHMPVAHARATAMSCLPLVFHAHAYATPSRLVCPPAARSMFVVLSHPEYAARHRTGVWI